MADEKKNTPAENTEDVVNTVGERSIGIGAAARSAESLEESSDNLRLNAGASRFIKTGETPFVRVHPQNGSTPADRQRHTGSTGKINTYDAVHAVNAPQGEKMIRTAEEDDSVFAAARRQAEKSAEAEKPTEVEKPAETASAVSGEPAQEQIRMEGVAPVETASVETDPAQTNVFSAEDLQAAAVEVTDEKTRVVELSADAPASGGADGKTKFVRTKGSLLKEIADSADEDVRRNPDQLMIDGFDDREKEEALERERQAEAARLEAELDKSRQKRINAFRFWGGAGETGASADEKFTGTRETSLLPGFLQKIADRFSHLDNAFAPIKSDEYTDENDRKAVFSTLIAARRFTLMRIAAAALLGLALFIIDLTASVSAANNGGFFAVFGGNYRVLIVINLVLLGICAGVMAADLKNGLFSLLKIRPKTDTFLLLLMLSSAAQLVAAFFSRQKLEADYHLLTPAVILLCVPYLAAKLFYLDNTRQCFKAAASKSNKSYLRKVSDESLVSRLLCETPAGETNVVYSGKTRFVSRFLARSAAGAAAGMPASRLVLICAGVSLIAAVVAGVMQGSFTAFISAFTLCLAFSFPVGSLTATGWAIAGENKKLSVKSSFVLSYADARDFAAVDNIAADASELIDSAVVNCLTAKSVSERQARFVAASIANKAGYLMRQTFASDIAAFEEKLPAAENVTYEDRLGLSAWVSGCKVLLGTNAILVNHNVSVPEENVVTALLGEDEYPIYLAIEGHFTAVFAVKYKRRANVGKGLSDLIAGGTNILLSTTDANITEVFAEQLLDLPDGSVRIIGSSAAAQLADAKNTVTDTEEAGIVFTESFGSLCRCAAAAVRLDKIKKISRLFCAAGAYVFLLVALILALTGAFTRVQPVSVILLHAAVLALCFASPTFMGLYSKVKVPAFLNKKAAGKESPGPVSGGPAPAPFTENVGFVQEELSALKAEPAAEPAAENPAEKIVPLEEPPEPEVHGEVSEEAQNALKNFEPDVSLFAPKDTRPAEEDAADAKAPVTSEKFKKTVASIGSWFTKLSADAENAEDEEGEELDAPARRRPREDGKPAFSLFSRDAVRTRRDRSAEEIEQDYEDNKQMEQALRATFTAPEMPPAPTFDLDKEETEEPVTEGSFEPPVSAGDVDVFDDALFSRFEDD